ncbi:KAP family P-loop NTPase fold protein [Dictyobacter formicarum]|uniref:NTPase n=1 Tax=Dictyobacter formicarum TaxID=2778368 RepID=A0ABQ3VH24_9CHLR|nr:P-loop NTPase fold protein [Dictyobacter formicarum]GHO85237.1 NTPase [Dictyobacter formicarum]
MIPDNPISTKDKDLLHRYPLASRIAGVINRFEGDESLVIGIEGEWGSGKTSFINMILDDLRTPKILSIKFNPWNFSDQNELIKDFFDSLIDALKETDESDTRAQKIKGYASKLLKQSEITLAPEFSALGIVNFKLGDVHKFGGEDPLEKQKESINKLLKELGKRIVIVIDDIDRLDSHETRLVFKLVKMTANFANTIFLLAYDKGKVCERINEKGIRGDEYLKKIIQVSFTLPKPDTQDLFDILTSDIEKTIQEFDEKHWDNERWRNLFYSSFKSFFPTIRDIKRYISSMQLDLEIIGHEEVNPIDFLGIEVIRVFAPEVYMAMADEKQVFTSTDNVSFGHNEYRNERKRVFEQILAEKSPQGTSDGLGKLIKQLFPQVNSLYTNHYYGHEQQQYWRKQLYVCATDIFDKYFSLSISSSTLSEKKLKDLLATINDRAAFTENLRRFQEEGKHRLVLNRLLDHLNTLSDQQRGNLVISVFDFSDGVKNRKRGLLDSDSQAEYIGYQVLKQIAPHKRVAFLTEILTSTKRLSSSIHLIGWVNHAIERQEKKEVIEELLLNKEDTDRLNEICVDRIKITAKDGTLLTEKNLLDILYEWKAWGSEAEVKEYVAEMIKTAAGLLALLRGFEWEAMSQTFGSFVAKSERKINKRALMDFTNIEELDKRIHRLNENELRYEERTLIKIYNDSSADTFG